MVNSREARSAGRRGRRIASTIVYPSMLLTVAVAGCASPTILQWPGTSGVAAPPARVAGVASPAADDGVRRTAVEPGSDVPTGRPAPSIPPADREYPIDLSTALRLAEVENPLIAEARQRIGEALALQQKARVLLLPDLNAGSNYSSHTGNLQRSSGTILNLDKKSLYFGGGAGAVTAGTMEVPAVNMVSQLTDAIFEPLAARQVVDGARFNASATANRILLEVAELHFELLAAEADLRVRRETAEEGAEVARLTRAYAEAEQGRPADAERAATELTLIEREVQHAEEGVAVASARLAWRLHLDQSVRVRPVAPGVELVTLIDPNATVPGLIQAALRGRPEVKERAALIAAAEARYREERFRPLLPTLAVGFSAGAFGGGSNLTGPQLAGFAGRTDFDVMAYWTLSNLGLGNLSLQKRRLTQVEQAIGAQSRTIAEIRTEVGAAVADVTSARQRVDVTIRQKASAERGFREDIERIHNTVGRPLEVVNSLQLLNQARVDLIRAITDYNQAEFRLFVALGSPPPLSEPASTPLPAAPIASPLLPPLAAGVGASESRLKAVATSRDVPRS